MEPPLTRYTIRRGRDATVGRRTLTLQRRFRTSSANPRNIMQQIESRAQMNWENWVLSREGGVITHGQTKGWMIDLPPDDRILWFRPQVKAGRGSE